MAQLINSLLNEIGDRLGLPGLSLDDNNQLFLDLEGDFVLSLEWRDSSETLLLNAVVYEQPIQDVRLLKVLLHTNCVFAEESAMAFTLSPATEHLYLSQVIPVDDRSSVKLEDKLDHFIRTASAWQARLNSPEPIQPDWE